MSRKTGSIDVWGVLLREVKASLVETTRGVSELLLDGLPYLVTRQNFGLFILMRIPLNFVQSRTALARTPYREGLYLFPPHAKRRGGEAFAASN